MLRDILHLIRFLASACIFSMCISVTESKGKVFNRHQLYVSLATLNQHFPNILTYASDRILNY